MIATLSGETQNVTRVKHGVIWCPFCDRSRQVSIASSFCEGCNAEFSEEAPEIQGESAPAPASRSRTRAAQDAEAVTQEEADAEIIADESE